MRRALLNISLGFILGLLVAAYQAHSQNRPPIPPQVFKAVRAHWQTKAERVQAFDVAWCESRFRTRAVSATGDYGLFQLNRKSHDNWLDWNRIFDPFYNARAAHRMWEQKGWEPWKYSRECWA
jgi:hypothetical protein